jgi:hypothetical protein
MPKGALGVTVVGPEIARCEETPPGSGRWRVELTGKWYHDRGMYPLQVGYETQFDRTVGELKLAAVKALGVDLQRGHIAVRTTERVELSPIPSQTTGATLAPVDARSVPRQFGADDLSVRSGLPSGCTGSSFGCSGGPPGRASDRHRRAAGFGLRIRRSAPPRAPGRRAVCPGVVRRERARAFFAAREQCREKITWRRN